MKSQYIPMTGAARGSLIGICVLWVLVAAVICLRLIARYRGIGIGADDILAAVALVLNTSTIGLNVAVFVSGVGYNMDPEIPEYPKLVANTEYIMQITFTFTLIYLWSLAALKLSQLCFYWRAFSLQLKKWIYIVGAIVIAWGLTFTFVFIFLCNPIQQQWSLQRLGHCLDQILVLKCIIMTNVVTDLLIFVLPIYTVWNLQMRKTERFAVIACFALGLGCCVIGIVRFWQIFVIDLEGNLTGTSLTTFMLCTVELMLAGLCISIPMLRPFYLRFREKYKSSQLSETNDQHSYKASGSKQLGADPKKPSHYTAWIELVCRVTTVFPFSALSNFYIPELRTDCSQNDRDQDTGSNGYDSEKQLTSRGAPPESGIKVSKDYHVTQSRR